MELYDQPKSQDFAAIVSGQRLITDEEGALYGTNGGGGVGNWPNGYGTIFKLTPPRTGQTAWTETTLYTFQGGGDGAAPVGLLSKKEGALYGTTSEGGGGNACPQVYQAVGCGAALTQAMEQFSS